MSKIISIGTAVPSFKYKQSEIFDFMQVLHGYDEDESRKIKLLYDRSGINYRHSVISDYKAQVHERNFFPQTKDMEPFPSLESRMDLFFKEAPQLSIQAIQKCIEDKIAYTEITHIITVSCTGLSAPGLEIQLIKELKLAPQIERSSINFMGCYAAVHALKQADYICKCDRDAKVLVVCVELCSIHFQKNKVMDNIAANLLFADGAAAVLICHDDIKGKGILLKNFYSFLELEGETDMAWNISSKGFLMTLSSYIPKLIENGIKRLADEAMKKLKLQQGEIKFWALHPGGRKILEVMQKELNLTSEALDSSYEILRNFGNMSSPTVLFVLKDIWEKADWKKNEKIFGAAFGPGLTMETFLCQTVID